MSSPEMKPTSRQAARRKLLGGAFSAPAVLTLYSGNALAAGSSLRCITNQVNGANTTKTVAVSTSTDAWLRVPLFTTGNGSSVPYKYYIRGSDVVVFQRPGRSCFIASGESWEFNPATISNSLVGSKLPGLPTGLSGSNCGKHAAVRFDASGNVTGCGSGLPGTSAMPATCWASAAPNL